METVTESGASPSSSGAEENKSDQGSQPETRQVRFDDHKRALDDMHKFKREATEAKSRLEELEAQKLREQGEWKTLAEREKELRLQAEQKAGKLNEALYQSRKFDEVYKEALKAGLRQEAISDLELIGLDGIEVELTSTGRMLVHGADSFVQELKRKRAHWFSSDRPPTVNSGGSAIAPMPEEVTPQMIIEAEKKGDKVRAAELTKKYMQHKYKR
jgi:hypothetical protein